MHKSHSPIIALTASLLFSPFAGGQCPPPTWSTANSYPGVDVFVYATTMWDPDGPGPLPPRLVVGGAFTFAGPNLSRGVAFYDGSSWQPMDIGQNANWNAGGNSIYALTTWNGDLIAGGDHTFGGSGVARWTANGWQTIGGGQNTVQSLVILNGQLYAAGTFNLPGGPTVRGAVRWNGTAWQPLPAANWINVVTAAVYNGQLVIAGTSNAQATQNHIGLWDGAMWQSLGSGMNAPVSSLTVQGGNLIAGGDFTTAGGVPASHVASWNGSTWQAVGPGFTDPVNALGTWTGAIVASASPSTNGPSTVYRWDGTAWQAFGTTDVRNVLSFTEDAGDLVCGGEFAGMGGIAAQFLARWNGTTWSTWAAGINGNVLSMTEFGGDLVLGGYFGMAGSVYANSVARWNGSSFTAFGGGISDGVVALTTHNNDLVAGGSFSLAGGAPAANIARWDGAAWHALGSGLVGSLPNLSVVPNTIVRALTVYNGELVAGGYFTTAGGTPVNYIARWNGTSWQPLGTGTFGGVHALLVYNGELIAGGAFASAGGVTVNDIARWNGTSWQPLGSGVGGGSVQALTIYGGELIAAGTFASASGVQSTCIARWNGSTWSSLGNVGNTGVTALGVSNGELFAAAKIWALPTGTTTGIARWNGTSWQAAGTGLQPTSSGTASGAFCLTPFRGALFAAGTLYGAVGVPSPSLVEWSAPLPLLALSQPAGNGTDVLVTNHWLIPAHEYYNIVSLDLAPGGPGTGPYGGLWFNNTAFLLQQLLMPIGAVPFHFVAASPDASFGPYTLPIGLSVEAVSVDVTGGVVGCISPVLPFTVY